MKDSYTFSSGIRAGISSYLSFFKNSMTLAQKVFFGGFENGTSISIKSEGLIKEPSKLDSSSSCLA